VSNFDIITSVFLGNKADFKIHSLNLHKPEEHVAYFNQFKMIAQVLCNSWGFSHSRAEPYEELQLVCHDYSRSWD
jgi:hypothetical protein